MQTLSQSAGAMVGKHGVNQSKFGVRASPVDQYSELLTFLV